jgi:hypothetical protein
MRNGFVLALAALFGVSFSVEPGIAASPGETYMRDCAVCHLPDFSVLRSSGTIRCSPRISNGSMKAVTEG